MLQRKTRREGTVVVAVAVSLIGLLGFLALSLDGGMVLDTRRHTQAAADAAALAAASELYSKSLTTGTAGTDPDGSIATFAKLVAEQNGFKDGTDGVTVTVKIKSDNFIQSSPFSGQPFYAEVIITTPQKRYFSGAFGSHASFPVKARAVAVGRRQLVKVGIMALDPTQPSSFWATGSGTVSISGGASIIVDSTAAGGMKSSGGGVISAVSPGRIEISGPSTNISGGGTINGPVDLSQPQQPDPLRFVPQPIASDYTKPKMPGGVSSGNGVSYNNANQITLLPGLYEGGISLGSKANVVFSPGIYYIKGALQITAGASVSGSGVMFYVDPQGNGAADKVNISGNGSAAVNLSPPTSGPYQGITLFQRRSGQYSDNDISISGAATNGTSKMGLTGTFYAANALMNATGNGSNDVLGSQYISRMVKTSGGGSFKVDWNPSIAPAIRELYLVE